MTEPKATPPVTKWTLIMWALPVLVGLGVVGLAFAMNWEPWFGYASVIAGAILSLMLAGNHFKIGPS